MDEDGDSSAVRCSTACTRSGIVALLLAALGFWLLAPLKSSVPLVALGQYVIERNNLRFYIEMMETDSCFISLKNSGSISDKSNISYVVDQRCIRANREGNKEVSLEETFGILKSLERLRRRLLWDLIEQTHANFSYPAHKWNFQWHLIWSQNPNYTLEQAKQLANFELPDLKLTAQFMEPRLILKMPWDPVALPPSDSAIMVGIGLLLCLGYFYLFWNEASLATYSSTPGTLLGSVTRSFITRTIFLTILSVPAISSGLVALRLFQTQRVLTEINAQTTQQDYAIIAIIEAILVIALCVGIARRTIPNVTPLGANLVPNNHDQS